MQISLYSDVYVQDQRLGAAAERWFDRGGHSSCGGREQAHRHSVREQGVSVRQQMLYTITNSCRWEDLEEKPVEGQWAYFERGTHTPTTQAR